MKRENIELLAPAGSYEGFEAAIGAGADAVYVGGASFGARAYAKNFTQEELLKAIDTAHIHGRKLYLTVNTLLKNRELTGQLYDYLLPYYKEGLDAVIVQDLGVFAAIRKMFPGLHLHASTQMTVTGPQGMKFLEEQGATRVVTARELSLEEIRKMHEASPIEIESFVHGALCYSYSGQCLMSSILGGRSGNRGRCAQPCRLPYDTQDKKGLCPLSLKDISTIEILPQILDAGVTSLKIEGRMKQPGYTAGVTAIYRKYLDILSEKGPSEYKVEEKDRKYLLDLFNRGGSCTGYYQMQNGPSMMAFANEKKIGELPKELKAAKEKIRGTLMLFPGSPAILQVSCRGIEASASAGEVQYAQNQPMDEERIRKQMEKLGNTPYVWEELTIETEGNIFVPVKVLNEVRREALQALEEEILRPGKRCTDSAISKSEELVSDALEKQKKVKEESLGVVLPSRKITVDKAEANVKSSNIRQKHLTGSSLDIYVSCEDTATALALCKEDGIKGMYLPFRAMEQCFDLGRSRGIDMYLSLPHITRSEMPSRYLAQAKQWLEQGMKGFLVRNLESFAALKKEGLASKCMLDHSMYTWNDQAVQFWNKQGVLGNTVPLELNEGEIRHRDNSRSQMLIYGYLPMMVSAQCIRKNLYGCNKKEESVTLRDRYDKEFPGVCFCNPWKIDNTGDFMPCYNIIYNSIPYGLLKEKKQTEGLGLSSVRLSFTMETPKEAVKIFREFRSVYRDDSTPPDRDYTKGHFRRGAE